MPGLFDFEGQLVLYKSFHQNCVNILWHIACVPLLLLGATFLLSPLDLFGGSYTHCDAGMAFALCFAIWYTLIYTQVGAPVGIAWIGVAYAAKNLYGSLPVVQRTLYMRWAWATHIFGWLGQMYGHIVHECRTQSIRNNFLQTLGLSLLFVVLEVMFIGGYKLELKKKIDPQAQALIEKYDAKAT